MAEPANLYSPHHPHEPEVAPVLDPEGRCLVCAFAIQQRQECEEQLDRLRTEKEHLRHRCENQARQLHFKDETLREKNLALDALHFVWCDGSCAGGVHRYTDETFTEEVVLQAEYQAKRLRMKYTNMTWVIENYPNLPNTQSDWHRQHVERLKRKLGYHNVSDPD